MPIPLPMTAVRAYSLKLARYLYDHSGGHIDTPHNLDHAGHQIGLVHPSHLGQVVSYLSTKGLIDRVDTSSARLTRKGLKAVESAINKPDTPTDDFPPLNARFSFLWGLISANIDLGSWWRRLTGRWRGRISGRPPGNHG